MTRIVTLQERIEAMTQEQCMMMNAYLVGWLADLVTVEQWEEATDRAIAHALSAERERESGPIRYRNAARLQRDARERAARIREARDSRDPRDPNANDKTLCRFTDGL